MQTIWIGVVLTVYTVLNIIFPISGSATVTPLLAMLTDPHRAIGLAVFYFFLSSVVRFFFFRKYIIWEEARHLIIPSAVAVLVGSLSLIAIPPLFLYIIVLISAVYFLLKKLKLLSLGNNNKHTASFVGVASGFLQGAGLAGADLRNTYLYSQGLSISQVHGTTTIIAITNFFIATIVRLFTDQLDVVDLSPVLLTLPFMILGAGVGKYLLNKISRKLSDIIVTSIMVVIVITLSYKIFGMF